MASMSGLTEQPESPRISGDGEYKEYTYIYKCLHGVDVVFPAKQSANTGGKGYFTQGSILPGVGYDTVEFTYSEKIPETGLAAIKEGKNQPTLRTSVMEKPLAGHPNYLVCWDHYLECKKADKATTLPAAWDEAKTKDSMVDNETFRWKHKSEAVGDGFVQRTAVVKPEVDSYYYPAAQVEERYYYRRKQDAASKAKSAGKKDTPKENFNITGVEWMNMGSEVQQDGHYWVCSVSFVAAVKWDDDIYTEAST